LTDVAVTSVANNDTLRYDSVASKWKNVNVGTAMSTTTMVPGFPDAIRCNVTNPNLGYRILYLQEGPYSDGRMIYREPSSQTATNDRLVEFNADGSFRSADSVYTTHDCGVSISSLYAQGRAFNFIGSSLVSAAAPAVGIQFNNGSGVLAGDTALVWDNTNKRLGIGTATPATRLDVQGTISAHGMKFPWRWNARSTTGLNFGTTTWQDVPGATVTFTLPVAADVFAQFDGSVAAQESGVHCSLGFTLNGTLQGNSMYGDLITMGAYSGADSAWWNAVSRSRWWSLSAGTHTLKIQGRSLPAATSADRCQTHNADYSRLTLTVIAYPQ
jgi:hypothetical protein